MDLKNLSSNWKKLQGTLKKDNASTATKRKPSDREPQDGAVKKRRTTDTVQGRKIPVHASAIKKRKRMSENPQDGSETGVDAKIVKTISRKSSTASLAVRAEVKTAKVNEGRSTR